MAGVDPNDWKYLVLQTQDLVAQNQNNFPRVSKDLLQLQQYAESLRARTNRFKSLQNQTAATRLLAQQGFDSSRLTQDISGLELQPNVEDVFDLEPTSVEEYLKQVEESTVLSAIQEAQQESVALFDNYMTDCMLQDWAADKRQLFGLLAPYTGAQPGTPGTAAAGTPAKTGFARGGTPVPAPSSPFAPVSGAVRLAGREAAYVAVVQRLSETAGSASSGIGNGTVDAVKEFKEACASCEEKTSEGSMTGCWQLLQDILSEAKAQGLSPVTLAPKYKDALIQGARNHLERGHAGHIRTAITRHRLLAERGGDPDTLREVQAYIQVKHSSHAPFDFQQIGGQDTSWLQVYYCLRSGWLEAARRAADQCHDLTAQRLGGDFSLRMLMEEWIRGGRKLPDRLSSLLVKEAERLLRDKAALAGPLKTPFAVLCCALLASDNKVLDQLLTAVSSLKLAPLLTTLEDYMWAKLSLVSSQASPSQASTSYGLPELAADLARWPPAYYTKNGAEPLLYVTVLLLSLQFSAAVKFLWQDASSRPYRLDAVHLAIALHWENVFSALPVDPSFDVALMVQSYGRKFVHQDSRTALHYYMLAAALSGGGMAVRGRLLRELLAESRDYGTLLGGGGAGGLGGALAMHVPDPAERRRLFEAVAYECQVSAQLEEAVELYLAADCPRPALAIINQQLSALLERAVEEQVTGLNITGACEAARRLDARGRDARGRVEATCFGDARAVREVEAWDQLHQIWALMVAARKGNHEEALNQLSMLSWLPLERTRVDACVRAMAGVHPAVQERVQDVLSAAASTLAALKQDASSQRLAMLKLQLDALLMFVNNISHYVSKQVFRKLSECAASFS